MSEAQDHKLRSGDAKVTVVFAEGRQLKSRPDQEISVRGDRACRPHSKPSATLQNEVLSRKGDEA